MRNMQLTAVNFDQNALGLKALVEASDKKNNKICPRRVNPMHSSAGGDRA